MTRTPEEVFAHHGQALGAEDLEDIVADYSDDAILVVQEKIYRGKDGARQVFSQLLNDVPEAPVGGRHGVRRRRALPGVEGGGRAVRSRTVSTRSSSRTA